MKSFVKAWKEKVMIPTYEVGKPEKYPVFLEKRVYQASSGTVYPHPVIEKISDEKKNKEWDAIFIENEFIKIMVLPQLGGRIQMAYDKIRKRHFVYYNEVIKPALVGLTGPWISGGIEFNWPQHHRPSTYDPVDCTIEEFEDGSKTIWVSEVERMFRTKGMAGFTLYPDKAYLEIKVQLYNRTPHPQTFLWWANPAVAVNEHYQSVFPPDVHAVFDHGKRDVSEFPIAKGTYYKVDYAPGTDISRYQNIPVPTSYMAIASKYDFVGGYENDSKGGLLHVADHHISPGKKQWTWGNGDFGYAWDRNLTDANGPYIELMCGVYTDNQPDFSWMHPYEEKSFKQYFMPYYNVGVVKNATKEALVNLQIVEKDVFLKIYVTASYKNTKVLLYKNNELIWEDQLHLHPATCFEKKFEVLASEYLQLKVIVKDEKGTILVGWSPETEPEKEIPEPAKAAKPPRDISTTEALYLQGLHLEQYRHATFDPTDYYQEALKRNPGDIRNNNAMGLWFFRKGKFEKALSYFETAIDSLLLRNPNPYNGEPFFNKGVVLNLMGNKNEAYSSFFKACWNAAWQDAGYFHLAQIDCSRGAIDKALELIDKSLIRNWHNHKARHLKIILLRKVNKNKEALQLIEDSLAIDPFNFGVLYEKFLLFQKKEDLEKLTKLLRGYAHNYIEFSLDYAQAGDFETALSFLELSQNGSNAKYPMLFYLKSWYSEQIGDKEKAKKIYQYASTLPRDYCFPNRLEEVIVLQSACKLNPEDANAFYYLGNFWYASRQYEEAKQCWEHAVKTDPANPIVHRNLALLYYNITNEKQRSQYHLERAFKLDKNARLLMELDQLYKKMNKPVPERLEFLEKYRDLTQSRDDLYLELITLHNFDNNQEKALQLLEARQFHPWEGGEGKVTSQYTSLNVEIAKDQINCGNFKNAIKYLNAAKNYPPNLGEGKLWGAQENEIDYWLGCAYHQLNESTKAEEYWIKASKGLSDPGLAVFYNDQQPDTIFYQGLALLKLGNEKEANKRFENLIHYGETHREDKIKLDYFAISLPDLQIWEEDLDVLNTIHCNYLIGLGALGLNHFEKAKIAFSLVLSQNLYHLPAFIHLKMIHDLKRQVFNN